MKLKLVQVVLFVAFLAPLSFAQATSKAKNTGQTTQHKIELSTFDCRI